jgi:hypothetical protein
MHIPDYSWVLYVLFSAVAAGIFLYMVGLLIWHRFYRTKAPESARRASAKSLDRQTDAIRVP